MRSRVRSLDSHLAELQAQRFECRVLRATRCLADFAHIVDVKVDQVLEHRGIHLRSQLGRFAAVDGTLGRQRPTSRVLVATKGLANVGLLASNLGALVAGGKLRECGHFVCAPCAQAGRRPAYLGVFECTRACTKRFS